MYTLVSGLCIVDGLVKSGSWGDIAQLPVECRPATKRLIFNLNNHGKTARVDVETNGKVVWVAGGQDHGWVSLTGIVFPVGGNSETLQLTNGWQNYGGIWGTPTYTLASGLCIVDGLVKSGSWGDIAQLPVECRPTKRLIFNLNNHEKTARVDVEPNGNVVWDAGGQDHGWVSLTGIVFLPTDQE